MKKILTAALALLIASGFSACGNKNAGADSFLTDDITISVTEDSIIEAANENYNADAAENTDEAPDVFDTDSEEAEDENVYVDDEGFLHVSADDLDDELIERICQLLEAAANNDEEAYLEIFDVDGFLNLQISAGYDGDPSSLLDDITVNRKFVCNLLNDDLRGSFGGEITDIRLALAESEISDCEAYYIAFAAKGNGVKVFIDGAIYLTDENWSIDIYPRSVIDDAYYDLGFKELIKEELLAAACGDKDKYMECVNADLLYEIVLAAAVEDAEFYDGDIEELRNEFWEMCDETFESLGSALGESCDGEIVWMPGFLQNEDIDIPGLILYEANPVTVKISENEEQDIECHAYVINGETGVFLQLF